MKIIGTGSAVPKLSVSNGDLATFLDTSDEWINTRTGINSRHILSDETIEELGARACLNALKMAGLKPKDIDYIICSNVYSSYVTPALSCVVAEKLKVFCPCIDINGACVGFIYALEMANAFIESGKYKNILILCAENASRLADWKDRSTCVLFGDAAAATIVTHGGCRKAAFQIESLPDSEVIYSYNPPGNCPYTKSYPEGSLMHMQGQDVYKFAVSISTVGLKRLIKSQGTDLSKIKFFLLHQANKRILEAVRSRLKQPEEKFPTNIDKYGNTSSASIPLLLDELNRSGKLSSGDYLAMSAFGAGLTAGACLITWGS
ncbi:MAG: ketoacyl-ACP synthase III [Eubacteriales bacterium]